MKLIGGQIEKINKFTMSVGFSSLPHGFEILKGNIHNRDAPPNGELAMLVSQRISFIQDSTLDPKPSWGTLANL